MVVAVVDIEPAALAVAKVAVATAAASAPKIAYHHHQEQTPTKDWERPCWKPLPDDLASRGHELLARAGQHGDDGVDAIRDAIGHVAALEARHDHVADDGVRRSVGQRAFQAVADLDPQLAIVRRDDQQRAVVLALLADAPAAAERQPPVLDRTAPQARKRDDHQLDRGLVLQALQLCGQPAFLARCSGCRPDRPRGRSMPAPAACQPAQALRSAAAQATAGAAATKAWSITDWRYRNRPSELRSRFRRPGTAPSPWRRDKAAPPTSGREWSSARYCIAGPRR